MRALWPLVVFAALEASGAARPQPAPPSRPAPAPAPGARAREDEPGAPPRRSAPPALALAPVPVPAHNGAAASRADLVAILASLVESYRLAHGSRIRLEFVAEEPEIAVGAEPVALQRAFRNVLDNAVKYTPAGGQVRVRASVVSQHAFVVISDTGAGMTPEEQQHAFTPAWRSPSAVAAGIPGRGIGLGVTKELLEQNGGKISLLSEPGHGLEVTIMFPLVREGRP